MTNESKVGSASRWYVDPSEPLGPQVYRIVRERIIGNDLPPGVRVSEVEIAQLYGISRQPVREAFVRLEEERLVAIRPKRATRVRRISTRAVADARFVREAVESDVVRAVARRPDAAIVAELRRQLRRQRNTPKRDLARFMELDETFHRTLAEAAGHADAWHFLESIKAQMDRVRYLALHRFPAAALIDQHEAIVDGVAARRPAEAERAMRAHLRGILVDLPRIVAAYPALFADADVSATPEAEGIAPSEDSPAVKKPS